MKNIASYVRIFNPTPDDDLVTKRTSAVQDISAELTKGKQSVTVIFDSATEIARVFESDNGPSAKLSAMVEGFIQTSSTSFLAAESELEVTVCAALAAHAALEDASPSSGDLLITDVLAIGIWSALSFQPARHEPKLEALRTELLSKARDVALSSAMSSRERVRVPEASWTTASDINSLQNVMKSGLKATVDALRSNAVIDREELDLLWWLVADWSHLFEQRFSRIKNPTAAAVARGIEVGRMLRRMPAEAHKHLVLRDVAKGKGVNLPELIAALGSERDRLAQPYAKNSLLSDSPGVFPLLTALVSGSASSSGSETKRLPEEWAARALLEATGLQVSSSIPSAAV